jgi:hypothetical protein
MIKGLTDIKTYPVAGGCVTDREKSQLKFGEFSWAQNIRGDHPGLRQRKGMSQLHTTAITGTPGIVNMYQYRSVRGSIQVLFVQLDGDDLWVQDTINVTIPDKRTGAFGSLSHTGSSGSLPASFGNVKDHMLYSNGVDQHQVYCGTGSLVNRFIVFDGAAAPADIPDNGREYSDEVRDTSNVTRVAVLDSLNTYAAFECIFINTKVPCNSLTWDVTAANGTSSVASLYYWNGTDWTAVSGFFDGTADSGATLAQDGEMTWTKPTTEQDKYMYGKNGFWYQIRVSVQLDAEVEVSSVTFDDSAPHDLWNIWDGLDVFAIEAQIYIDANTNYELYGAASVDIGEMTTSDILYIASADKIEGIYVDTGTLANSSTSPTFTISYWDGASWVSVGTVTDGTNGFKNAGWLTFARKPAEPREFNTSKYQAFWYKIVPSAAIDESVIVGISCMPYYDITDFGSIGHTNAVWKERGCYSFNQYGPYIYVAKNSQPLVLNGADFGILKAGDGRYNKIVAKEKFVNELMVWQEEIGHEGGCVTIFEGYSPTTFGKLVLSSKIGTMNAKSVVVVDGVMTTTPTESRLKTLAFFLSRYGVCVTDGRTISIISDDIRNYFDPQDSDSINIDQKNKMWIAYDSAESVVRLGLVTGAATTCNTFPVFDVIDKTWSFDTPAPALLCMAEVSPDAGATESNVSTVQLGGGTDDGFIYRLNHGTNDYDGAVETAIDTYIDIELNADGEYMLLNEMVVRSKVKSAGDIDLKFYKDDILVGSKSISMTAEVTNAKSRRHRFYLNIQGHNITVRMQNDTIDEDINLFDVGLGVGAWDGV